MVVVLCCKLLLLLRNDQVTSSNDLELMRIYHKMKEKSRFWVTNHKTSNQPQIRPNPPSHSLHVQKLLSALKVLQLQETTLFPLHNQANVNYLNNKSKPTTKNIHPKYQTNTMSLVIVGLACFFSYSCV